jgi:hypothetical protein
MILGGGRGMMFGALGGFCLGAVGGLFPNTAGDPSEITWRDPRQKKCKLTHMDLLDEYDMLADLYVLYTHREYDVDAYNDAVQNIQRIVVFLARSREKPQIMLASRVTTVAISATKAMRQLHEESKNGPSRNRIHAEEIEKAMMHLHLAFESIIDQIRIDSRTALE